MRISTLSVDCLRLALALLDVHDIIALWITGDTSIHRALGLAGGIQALRASNRIVCPSFLPQLRGLVEFEYSYPKDVRYQFPMGVSLQLLPKTLKKLILSFSNAFICLFSAHRTSVADLFPQLEYLSVNSFMMPYILEESSIQLPSTLALLHLRTSTFKGFSASLFDKLPHSLTDLDVDLDGALKSPTWSKQLVLPPSLRALVLRGLDSLKLLNGVPCSVTRLELHLLRTDNGRMNAQELESLSRLSCLTQLDHLTISGRILGLEHFHVLPRGCLKEMSLEIDSRQKLENLISVLPSPLLLERLRMKVRVSTSSNLVELLPNLKEWNDVTFDTSPAIRLGLELPILLPGMDTVIFSSLTPVATMFLPRSVTKMTIHSFERPSASLKHLAALSSLVSLRIITLEKEIVHLPDGKTKVFTSSANWMPPSLKSAFIPISICIPFIEPEQQKSLELTSSHGDERRMLAPHQNLQSLEVSDLDSHISLDWITTIPPSITAMYLKCSRPLPAQALTVLPKSLKRCSITFVEDYGDDHLNQLPRRLIELIISKGACHLTLEGAKALPKTLRTLVTEKLDWVDATPIETLLSCLPPHLEQFRPHKDESYSQWQAHQQQLQVMLCSFT